MYSDDEQTAFGGGGGRSPARSPTPPRGRDRGGDRGGRSRSRGRGGNYSGHDDRRPGGREAGGKDKGKDKGKGKRGPRTTGQKIPALNSIHKGTIARVQSFGAFVRLGDGATYKDGLLHISRLSASGRVDQVEDVVAENDTVWVKVVELKDEEGKYSVDMRFVGQKDGEDKDPHNTQADIGGKGKGKGGPEPIRIGAVQATTCTRCGAKGHSARECFAASGQQFGLLEENPAERRARPAAELPAEDSAAPGHDPKVVKAALKAYLKRKAPGEASSSSSSSSSSSKKKKKAKKKEKKQKKKEKKKEKKEQKKLKKNLKKEAKAKAKTEGSKAKTAGGKAPSSSSS